MTPALAFVLVLLAGCAALFLFGRPRMDVVALLALILLPLSGVLTVPEAIAGFSDPSVVLIGALFVVGEGLVRTGVAARLGGWLMRVAGNSETRLLILLIVSVVMLGSVMSSTGVVALFIPVVLSVAERLRVSPSRLMMPLSFAGLISGMMTLVATPPNLVVDSALRQHGFGGLTLLSFTPIGLVVLAFGVGYMLIARRGLRHENGAGRGGARRSFVDLIRAYDLAGHERRARVRPDSLLIGRPLRELGLRQDHWANVIAIERPGRFRADLLNPTPETELRAGDTLLLDVRAQDRDPADLNHVLGLDPLPLAGDRLTEESTGVGMAEIMFTPDSDLLGKTVIEQTFRRSHGVTVIGLRRGREALPDRILDEKLKLGDTLLVAGPWTSIRMLQQQTHDFVVLSLPGEAARAVPAPRQAPFALLSLAIMVVLMVTGLVPNVVAALIACVLMGLFRCVDLESAYRSIQWQILILIVGMLPFALALQKTGGIDLAVSGLLDTLGSAGPRIVLAVLFVLTAGIGLFISNTATAVLMAPIALGTAAHLGLSPYPFVMTVAYAASAAFMTPVSSPVNLLVVGPGRYRFSDFIKIGVPFTLLVLLVTVGLVPVLFPFS